MITEALRALGSWDLNLKQSTPDAIRQYLNPDTYGASQLVITDNRIDPYALSGSTLRSIARYVGIYTGMPDAFSLEGAGLAWLLADDKGIGDVVSTRVAHSAATLSTVLGSLFPSNGLSTGTITNTGLNSITCDWLYADRRECLDVACDIAGADWRINPTLTVDAAAPATLFTSYTTPSAIVTKLTKGRARSPFGLIPTDLTEAASLDQYTTKVHVLARADGGLTVATATAGTVPFYAPGSASKIKRERVVDAPSVASTDSTNYATNTLAQWNAVTRAIRLAVDEYDLPANVRPGDRLWVYDPDLGLVDLTSGGVVHEGQTLYPRAVRCLAITWPLRGGLGVYLIRSDASSTSQAIVDLSDWYVPEDGDATVEVGAYDAEIGPTYTATQPSPTGDVAFKTLEAWTTYTPTWAASGTAPAIGNGFIGGWYKRIGQVVHFRIRVNPGTTTTFGTGTWSFTVPVTAYELGPCGSHAILDLGVNWYHGSALLDSTTTVSLGLDTGFAGQGTPATLGSGDGIYVAGTYEAA